MNMFVNYLNTIEMANKILQHEGISLSWKENKFMHANGDSLLTSMPVDTKVANKIIEQIQAANSKFIDLIGKDNFKIEPSNFPAQSMITIDLNELHEKIRFGENNPVVQELKTLESSDQKSRPA